MRFGPNIHTYISNLDSFSDPPRPQRLDIYRQKTENRQQKLQKLIVTRKCTLDVWALFLDIYRAKRAKHTYIHFDVTTF